MKRLNNNKEQRLIRQLVSQSKVLVKCICQIPLILVTEKLRAFHNWQDPIYDKKKFPLKIKNKKPMQEASLGLIKTVKLSTSYQAQTKPQRKHGRRHSHVPT